MDIEDRISALIAPSLDAMGYDLVRVSLMGLRRRTLQVMAERRDEAPMTVDDCADISRAVSALLDVEDPISGSYDLEVSSPGIDRPLVRPGDFERFAGLEARIETNRPVMERKRFKGRIIGLVDGGTVRLALENGEERLIPYDAIHRARLVMTDELIAFAMNRRNH